MCECVCLNFNCFHCKPVFDSFLLSLSGHVYWDLMLGSNLLSQLSYKRKYLLKIATENQLNHMRKYTPVRTSYQTQEDQESGI